LKIKTIRIRELYVDTIEKNLPDNAKEIIDIKIHHTGNKDFPVGVTYLYN